MKTATPLTMTLSPGQEKIKAREFMDRISRVIDGSKNSPIAQTAYLVIGCLFEAFAGDEKDYGYMVGYQSEETPCIDDINYNADYEVFRSMVDRHTLFEGPTDGYLERKQVFNAFWAILARQILSNLPQHSHDLAKIHIENGVMSMFNGTNSSGIEFGIRYAELDHETNETLVTEDFGELLLSAQFNF